MAAGTPAGCRGSVMMLSDAVLGARLATAPISHNVPKSPGGKRQGALACVAITACLLNLLDRAGVFNACRAQQKLPKTRSNLGKGTSITELKCDAHPDCAVKAVRTLSNMEKMLAQMEADYAGAQERLAQATTDEKSL